MPPPGGLFNHLRFWLDSPVSVGVVCEIAANHVTALRCQRNRVDAWVTRPLPPGVVRPAPLSDNVADPTSLQRVLEEVLGAVVNGQRRCALLVPDLLTRTTVLEFEELPARADKMEELLAWRLKKELPFDSGQAKFSYSAWPGRTAAHDVLVAVCLRELLRQYEGAIERLGLEPGWVTLSTLATLGCLSESEAPRLLVKRDPKSLSLGILHLGGVRLFRNLPLAEEGEGIREEVLFEKIFPAVIHFQDHWDEQLREIILVGTGGKGAALGARLEKETGCAVREFVPTALDLPPSPVSGEAADARVLPCLGWAQGAAG